MGLSWNGSQVVACVCEPDVVPKGYLGIRTAKTDTMGASLSFPSHWLLSPVNQHGLNSADPEETKSTLPASNIVGALRYAVATHLHEMNLNAERAAEICGINKRTLARRLAARGTSIGSEISAMRRERASQLLADTDKTVRAVALDVGYPDPAVFSRAFKRWTGMTPSQYRKKETGQARKTRG